MQPYEKKTRAVDPVMKKTHQISRSFFFGMKQDQVTEKYVAYMLEYRMKILVGGFNLSEKC